LGEEILVAGFPWGRRLEEFRGIVSQLLVERKEATTPDDGSDQAIMLDAAAAKRVSGGGYTW
jgi:hypothetical protein